MKDRPQHFVALYWLFIFFIPALLFSQESILQEEEDFRFASQLENKGMFDLAALQFWKYAENYPASPRSPEALFRSAQNYERLDSLNLASQAYMRLFFRYPDSKYLDRAQLNRARILSRQGQHQKAALMLERIRIFTPESEIVPQAQLLAAQEFMAASLLRRATDAVMYVLEKYPTHPDRFRAHFILAQIYLRQQKPQVALQQLDRIVGERIEDDLVVSAQLLRATILRRLGRYAKADSLLQSILDSGLQSDSVAVAAQELATRLVKRGNYQQAETVIHKALKLKLPPAHQAVLEMLMADTRYFQNDFSGALEIYSSVKSKVLPEPKRIALQFRLGTVLQKLGKSEQAINHFRQVITLADSTAGENALAFTARLETARALRRLGKSVEAIRFLRSFLSQGDRSQKDRLLYEIARIQEEDLKDYTAARRNYSIITEMYSKSPLVARAQLGIARTYELDGIHNLAIREYQRYLSLYPGADDYKAIVQKLSLLKKFRPADPSRASIAVNRVLINNLTGNNQRKALYDLAQDQIYVFHNYQAALRVMKQAFTITDENQSDQGKMLYLMALSHANLAEKYRWQGKSHQAKLHSDSLAVIQSIMEKNFAPSPWMGKTTYLLVNDQLQQLLDPLSRAAFLDTTLIAIQQLSLPDSLMAPLQLALAQALFLAQTDSTASDSTLAKIDTLCQQVERRRVEDQLVAKAVFLRAMVDYRNGELDSAIVKLSDLVERFPASHLRVEANYQLAQLYEFKGQLHQAGAIYSDIFQRYFYASIAAKARLRYANILIEQGQWQQAQRFLRQSFPILKQDDLFLFLNHNYLEEATWLWALAQEKSGNVQRTISALREYLSAYPDGRHRKEALFSIANLAAGANELQIALGHYHELMQLAPGDTLASLALVKSADIYFDSGDYRTALERYQEAKDRLTGDLLRHVSARQVICEFRLGKVARAKNLARTFKKAFDDRNSEAKFLYEEGDYYLKQKKFKLAEKAFKELSKKYGDVPEGGRGQLGLGRLYVILNRTDEALKILTGIPDKFNDPEIVATAYLNLGDFYYKNRQLENSIFAFKKVLTLQKHGAIHERALRLLISAYDDVQLWDRAIALAREYVKDYPNSSFYISKRIDIGLFLIKLKEFDRAIAYLRNLKPLVDANTEPQVQYWIAKAYAEQGHTEQAITEFLKVKYLSKPTKLPWGDTALYEAAQAYKKMGNLEKAHELFKEIVRSRGVGDQIGRVANERLQELEKEMAKAS